MMMSHLVRIHFLIVMVNSFSSFLNSFFCFHSCFLYLNSDVILFLYLYCSFFLLEDELDRDRLAGLSPRNASQSSRSSYLSSPTVDHHSHHSSSGGGGFRNKLASGINAIRDKI